MAPVAIYQSPPDTNISKSTAFASVKGPALVIGSLSTAQDGKYQSVVSELEATRQVERQMLDRLLDRGNVQFIFLDGAAQLSGKPLSSNRNLIRPFILPCPHLITNFCNLVYPSYFHNSLRGFLLWEPFTYFNGRP